MGTFREIPSNGLSCVYCVLMLLLRYLLISVSSCVVVFAMFCFAVVRCVVFRAFMSTSTNGTLVTTKRTTSNHRCVFIIYVSI